MDRETILNEIRRAAAESGGAAPGQIQFERRTGITPGQWRGKLWLKWSDAVSEAGLTPGRMQGAYTDDVLLAHLAELVLACGRFPTTAELKMRRVRDATFPSHNVFDRLGERSVRIARLRDFASLRPELHRVVSLLGAVGDIDRGESGAPSDTEALREGYVYMLKLGKHYKVGMTTDVPRRHRQIALELPEKPNVIHSIRTDDPEGIEAYWHRRFAAKATNGEWFALDSKDIRAFKRRKFM
jgi:hypothetical protein